VAEPSRTEFLGSDCMRDERETASAAAVDIPLILDESAATNDQLLDLDK